MIHFPFQREENNLKSNSPHDAEFDLRLELSLGLISLHGF